VPKCGKFFLLLTPNLCPNEENYYSDSVALQEVYLKGMIFLEREIARNKRFE
jgi:hypothetical protein